MSRNEHEKESADQLQSVFATHPDYELFHKLGSPQNFLTRQFGGGDVDRSLTPHYSNSQRVFANYSMKCLINLVRDFPDNSSMEEFYEKLAQERIRITIATRDNLQDEVTVKRAYKNLVGPEVYQEEIGGDVPKGAIHKGEEVREWADVLYEMRYKKNLEMPPSSTALSGNKKYEKYFGEDTQGVLILPFFIRLIGQESRMEDHDINLGVFLKKDDGQIEHLMGAYRFDNFPGNMETKEKRIKRVEEITNLTLKKALETDDKDEAMKYAFAYGILRGYNLRSAVGACFAQEMSMRWLFEKKGWDQFNKFPGVYLDIEAALVGARSSYSTNYQKFEKMVTKSISDYETARMAAVDPDIMLGDSPLFDRPVPQQENDFVIYLMETRSYRREDLPALVAHPLAQEFFNIAARNGDSEFFKMMKEEIEEKPEFMKLHWELTDRLNHEEVVENALLYGGEVMLLASNLSQPPQPNAKSPDGEQVSPVSVVDVNVTPGKF